MTTLGVFRDDYYNPLSAVPQAQIKSTVQNGGLLPANLLSGAQDTYLNASGQTGAQAMTTDTAANIVANIVSVIQAGAAGSFPAPNLNGSTYTLTISNLNASAGTITLTGGVGVTIVGTNTVVFGNQVVFVVSITSPTNITVTRVYSDSVAA